MEWTFSLSQLEKEKELLEENIKDKDQKISKKLLKKMLKIGLKKNSKELLFKPIRNNENNSVNLK